MYKIFGYSRITPKFCGVIKIIHNDETVYSLF